MSGKSEANARLSRNINAAKSLGMFVVSVTTGLIATATVLGFLGRWWWCFELAAHFRVQYLVLLSASALVYLVRRKMKPAAIAVFFAGLNLWLVAPLYFGPTVDANDKPIVRVLSLNVHTFNKQHARVLDFVRSADADLVLLMEVDRAWQTVLAQLADEYEFFHFEPRDGAFGMALFSRHPMEDLSVTTTEGVDVPCITARVDIGGERLTIIGGHTLPPRSARYSKIRNRQLVELAELSNSQSGPVMLIGDLNISPWSPFFRDLLRDTQLQDSRRGFGVHATWPADPPWMRIPIDHCLTSPEIAIHLHRIGPYVGSDHFGIIVDFSVDGSVGAD